MGWLTRLLPFQYWIFGSIFFVQLGIVAAQRFEIGDLERDLQAEKTARQADRTVAAEAAASAALAYRAREQAWAKSHEEIVNAAIQKTEAAASAVVAADAAARSLHDRAAAVAAAGRTAACRPATARASAPAGDPIGMLADVLARADAAAGLMAATADRARIAGLACEQSYEALRR